MNALSIFSRPGVKLVTPAATADLGPGMHPRISIKGGRFTLIDAGGVKYPWPNLTLPVIIVGANPKKSKVYYENGYDPDSTAPPTCYSDNGVAPSINATRKMARSCAECELGAWGSDTSPLTGKGTKACNDRKKLAVIVVGDTAGLAYELQIPPASLKNLNKHAGLIASHTVPDGSRKADLSDMVTMVSFTPDQVGVLEFQPACWLDSVGPDGQIARDQAGAPVSAADGGAAIAQRLDALWETEIVDELVGLNDKPWTGTQLPSLPLQASPPALPASQGMMVNSAPPPPPPPYAPNPLAQFAGPAGAQPVLPQQAEAPAASKRGGARAGAGRPPGRPPKTESLPVQGQVFPPAPSAASAEALPVPPFLQRAATPGAPNAVQHGMTDAPPPPTGIQEAVNRAFALPTRPAQ